MFRSWRAGVLLLGVLAAAQEKASSPADSRGKTLFEQCRGCHSAETNEKKAGPSLKGIFKRNRLRNGEAVTEKTVRSKIDLGGGGMPAYSRTLSETEKHDLIAYLKGL